MTTFFLELSIIGKGEVGFLSPADDVEPLLLEQPILFLQSCFLVRNKIHRGSDLLNLQILCVFLFLHLASHFVELIHLFGHLRCCVLMSTPPCLPSTPPSPAALAFLLHSLHLLPPPPPLASP